MPADFRGGRGWRRMQVDPDFQFQEHKMSRFPWKESLEDKSGGHVSLTWAVGIGFTGKGGM